jgi:hypothetical protein
MHGTNCVMLFSCTESESMCQGVITDYRILSLHALVHHYAPKTTKWARHVGMGTLHTDASPTQHHDCNCSRLVWCDGTHVGFIAICGPCVATERGRAGKCNRSRNTVLTRCLVRSTVHCFDTVPRWETLPPTSPTP